MKLTEEQRKLAEDNYNLIYGFATKYKLNLEEYHGVLAEALCMACRTWRKDGGAQISTYVYKKMMGSMAHYVNHKIKIKGAIPEDMLVYGDAQYYEARETLFGVIHDRRCVETEAINKVTLQQYTSRLNKRDRVILSMMVCGEKQETIAECVGINQSYVSRKQRKMRKELKELLCL